MGIFMFVILYSSVLSCGFVTDFMLVLSFSVWTVYASCLVLFFGDGKVGISQIGKYTLGENR